MLQRGGSGYRDEAPLLIYSYSYFFKVNRNSYFLVKTKYENFIKILTNESGEKIESIF